MIQKFRTLLLLIFLIFLIASFAWLASLNGSLVYTDGDNNVTTSAPVAAGSLILSALLLAICWGFLGWLWALPEKVRKSQTETNRKKALDYYGFALSALDSGDIIESRRQTKRALKALPENSAIKYLAAKSALAEDDLEYAENLFHQLSSVGGYENAAKKGLGEIAKKRAPNV